MASTLIPAEQLIWLSSTLVKPLTRCPINVWCLNYYGFVGPLATWVENFLTGHTQRVLVNGILSELAAVDSIGSTTGTVTGPLWFLLFIDDLPSVLKSLWRLFANDCIVYSPVQNDEKSQDLQTDLESLEDWQNRWLMEFNPSKCVTMSISTRGSSQCIYNFCGQDLDSVDSSPYLGIEFSSNCSWNNQSQAAAKKARKTQLGSSGVTCGAAVKKSKLQLTKHSVHHSPIVEYASTAWDPSTQTNIDTLNRVQ